MSGAHRAGRRCERHTIDRLFCYTAPIARLGARFELVFRSDVPSGLHGCSARAVRGLRAMGYCDALNAADLKVKEVLGATTDATTREKNADLEELASTKS